MQSLGNLLEHSVDLVVIEVFDDGRASLNREPEVCGLTDPMIVSVFNGSSRTHFLLPVCA